MKFSIHKELPGRMRVKLIGPVPAEDLGALESVLAASPAITSARIYPRIGSIAFTYDRSDEDARRQALAYLCAINAEMIDAHREGHSLSTSSLTENLFLDIAVLIGAYVVRRAFLPKPLAFLYALWSFRRYARPALASLARPQLDVPVLDASAIALSLARRDVQTAGETMFLLDLGETLENFTQARSEGALIDALMGASEMAHKVEGDTETEVNVADLHAGDIIAVRMGMPVPVDGRVVQGCASVNQASLTGEPLAVPRAVGDLSLIHI